MATRYICPLCHAAIDPLSMDSGCCENAELRFCSSCDAPVVVKMNERSTVAMHEMASAPETTEPVAA